MKKKNKISFIIFILTVAIPTILSVLATCYKSITLLIITILSMLFMLATPIYKHRENLGMFVILSFISIPINILLVKTISESVVFNYGGIFTYIFRGFFIYSVLFAIEQIVLGIITRFFYRRQYKLL